jgi:hypothetical protein
MISVRPFLKMLASAISSPFVTGARKLHFNSMVVIPEAGSRTVMAAWAIASSARATISPPLQEAAHLQVLRTKRHPETRISFTHFFEGYVKVIEIGVQILFARLKPS